MPSASTAAAESIGGAMMLNDLPEPVCGGCKRDIDEASANSGAISFAGALWHIDCFRCAKCNNRVTTGQDDLLLLSDGHPICSSCNYTCQVCKQPILEEAILTGDEAYHASCFTCRVCTKRIEELVFAKTTQGIYCMDCHHQRVERSKRHAEAKKQRAAAKAAAAAAAASASPAASRPSGTSPTAANAAPSITTPSSSAPPTSSSTRTKQLQQQHASRPASPSPSLSLSATGNPPRSAASPRIGTSTLVKSDSTPITRTVTEPPSSAALTSTPSSPLLYSLGQGHGLEPAPMQRRPSSGTSSPVASSSFLKAGAPSKEASPTPSRSSSAQSVSPDTSANGSRATSAASHTPSANLTGSSVTFRGRDPSSPRPSTKATSLNTEADSKKKPPASASAGLLSVASAHREGSSSRASRSSSSSRADRASKTYSFYDPDFVDLMDSFGRIGTEDSDLSLSLPQKEDGQSGATPKSAGARGKSAEGEQREEVDDVQQGTSGADRRRTLKPGSLGGKESLLAGLGGVGTARAGGQSDSSSMLGLGGSARGGSSTMGLIPSASASMESFALFDGYESTDSLFAPVEDLGGRGGRVNSYLSLNSNTARNNRRHSRALTGDSYTGSFAGGQSANELSESESSVGEGSRTTSVLYLAAVTEAEKRMRERKDSAAKLDSRYGHQRQGSESQREDGEGDSEVDMGPLSLGLGGARGAGLTRDGTLRASTAAGNKKSTAAASMASTGSGSVDRNSAGGAGAGGNGTGWSAFGRRASGGLNSAPLRALSLKVKEKIQGATGGSGASNASGTAGAASNSSSAGASAMAKDAKGNLVQMEPELLEALLSQLDAARDQMESMQGRYDGMKRASRLAAHGYNKASQKFELEVNARYEAEVEMASLKRKLAEQASKLTAVTGEQKRNEALLRRSQDVRSMVTDMERNLAMLTVERDVRMAELAQLTAANAASLTNVSSSATKDKHTSSSTSNLPAAPSTPTKTTSSPSALQASSPSSAALSPALPSPSTPQANPLLSPLLGGSNSGFNQAPGLKSKASSQNLAPGSGIDPKDAHERVVQNLTARLDSVKEKYKREIDELALERDALLVEIDELRQSRDVFVDEAQALNARNEEASAQLTLLQKRIEFAERQETARANAARLREKQLPTPSKSPPVSAGPSGGGGGGFGLFGTSGKHRANNSMSSALELGGGGGGYYNHHAGASEAEIARPVRVQKAEATPVVKKFKWMKASAKVAGQGIAAALPGTGLSSVNTGGNQYNANGGGASGDRSGSIGGSSNGNGGGHLSNGGQNGHHPAGLSPNGMYHGGPGGSPGLSPSGMSGSGSGGHNGGSISVNGQQGGGGGGNSTDDRPPVDGIVVREHLFQPFNILRPIRCFACQKNMWGQSEVRCALCGQSCHSKCLQNLPTSCLQPYSGGQEPAEPVGPSMFGRDLTEQASAEGRDVPEIVEKCVAAVEAGGMDYEGIYRKSGGTSQLRVITQLFERGQPFDLQDMDRFNDVSAITSVLKNYFRELPVPLLTFELHEAFIRVAEMRVDPNAAAGAASNGDGSATTNSTTTTHEKKMERMAELIAQLPHAHFWTLRHLIVHLHRVQSRADENRMNSRNLGVVFGPTLMRSSDPTQEFAHMGGKAMTIEFFIDNPSLFAV